MKKTAMRQLLLLSIVAYIVISSFAVFFQYHWITKYQYEEMGQNALRLAQISASALKMSTAQLEELHTLEFEEMLANPCNQQLEELFSKIDSTGDIKYAYLIRQLPKDDIKYRVEEQDSEFFGEPVGTELDSIWLLDVIVDHQEQTIVNSTLDYYMDKHRYTKLEEDVKVLLEHEQSDYVLWSDEWGTQIAGLTPFYTEEGEYVGLLGVDIYSDTFYAYRARVLWTLIILIIVPTLILTGLYLYLHFSYRYRMNLLAYADGLTGLNNRRYYEQYSMKYRKEAVRKKQNLGMIVCDIDHFKHYNDTYGHLVGDEALKITARVLQEVTEGTQGFVSRYGGEEFVIVCVNTEVAKLCEIIRHKVEQTPIPTEEGQNTYLTVSLGAYQCIPAEEGAMEEYFVQADQALYEAKGSGRNKSVVRGEGN